MKPAPVDLSRYLATCSVPENELLRLFPSDAPLVIFDIGACEGEDTIRYARRFPHARVYAFEPLPENQLIIAENLRLHQVSNAELVPLALSDRDGEATLHVSSGEPEERFCGENWNYGNKSSSLLEPVRGGEMPAWLKFRQPIPVRTRTLDSFCAARGIARVDFVHMDVQGAEYLVLQGAKASLPTIRALWIEVMTTEVYRGQRLKPEVQAFLTAQDFALVTEDQRGIEGDCFYVNTRWLRGRWRAWKARLGRVVRASRAKLGRLNRRHAG